MAKAKKREQRRRRLSLSVRLTLLVLLAALLPLAAVVGFNVYTARGTLIKNGRATLATDAQSKVTLVNQYFKERELDGQAITSLPTTPAYLACIYESLPIATPEQAAAIESLAHCSDPLQGAQFYKGSNSRALHVGPNRDPNYTTWALFFVDGTPLLWHIAKDPEGPLTSTVPAPDLPKADLAVVAQGKEYISPVYYDTNGKFAYVNIYTPVAFQGRVLGFVQARLKLDYVNQLVAGESGADGTGSYAFIADQNGVRIADTDPNGLYHAVQPLDAATLAQIAGQQRLGGGATLTVDPLPEVAASLKANTPSDSFQGIATPGSAIKYQFVRQSLDQSLIPWNYFVLSPLSTVTAVADTQVKNSLEAAAAIAIVAILLGLLFGTRTAKPVSESAADLEGAATALKLLASRQQSSAGEQQWVVDACRTGLDSVRYLSDAMNQAAKRIIDASNWFGEYWDRLNEEQARRTVQHLLELARYIDEAARRQHASSDRLGKAITVTMQVSDQLVSGADAATRSADQLEQVVLNLQHVVGGRTRGTPLSDEEQMEQMNQMSAMTMEPMEPMMPIGPAPMGPYRGKRSGYLEAPVQAAQRQLPAPQPNAEQWGRQPARPSQAAPSQWGGNGYNNGNSNGYNNGNSNGYNSNGHNNSGHNSSGHNSSGGGYGDDF